MNYFEFEKDGKIMILKCNRIKTGYNFFMLFTQNRNTEGYRRINSK
jgi:hypothetical protein